MRNVLVKESWGADFRNVPKVSDPLLPVDLGLNIPCTSYVAINKVNSRNQCLVSCPT